jgi:hypothetical protein
MANLASSEGCKLMAPIGNQRRDRLTTLPMPGIKTMINKIKATTSSFEACFSQKLMGICSTAIANTKASPMNMACRTAK